jgi:hypothetical protein
MIIESHSFSILSFERITKLVLKKSGSGKSPDHFIPAVDKPVGLTFHCPMQAEICLLHVIACQA